MIAKVFLRKIMRKYLFFRKFLEILCRTAANARDSWKNVYNCKKCILFPKVDFFAITKFRGISPKYITFRIFAKRRRHFRLTLVIGKRLNFVELVLTWARGVLLLPVPTVAVWSSRRADLRNVQLSVPLSWQMFLSTLKHVRNTWRQQQISLSLPRLHTPSVGWWADT
jgi:hypothetical protein